MKEIYYRSNGDLCGRGEGTRVGEGGYFFIGCSEKEKNPKDVAQLQQYHRFLRNPLDQFLKINQN